MRRETVSRRRFLRTSARVGGALAGTAWAGGLLGRGAGLALAGEPPLAPAATSPLARYWIPADAAAGAPPVPPYGSRCLGCHDAEPLDGAVEHRHETAWVRCLLCAQGCQLAPGERGTCRARINLDGELHTLTYGHPIAVHTDPIEKKPFYHFLPGSRAYSIGTAGCPLRCRFCQNWEISQARPEDYEGPSVPPERIVTGAWDQRAAVIAFTYNEPTVFTEYLTDIARLARPQGLRTAMVSCGFMTEAPLTEMCETLDAIKIDLKGFSRDFYRKVCEAEIDPVLRSIRQVGRSAAHLEIVNLVVPTLNDSDDMLKQLAAWVVGEVGPDVPVHFTRFHPDYRLRNLPPTPVATLERAREIGMDAGLRYAYVGNVHGHPGNHTYCPRCGRTVIERRGFFVERVRLEEGRCASCGEPIAGVWS